MSNEFYHRDRNNHQFLIRPIRPSDKEYLKIGLKNLSSESRHQRFHSGKKEFSEKELHFLTNVDMINHLAFVTCLELNSQEIPAGVIRGIKSDKNPHFLEIAVTIVDQYQGLGLGSTLLKILKNNALLLGYTHFVGDLHNTNHKMLKLLQKICIKEADLKITHIGEGFLYFELCLS